LIQTKLSSSGSIPPCPAECVDLTDKAPGGKTQVVQHLDGASACSVSSGHSFGYLSVWTAAMILKLYVPDVDR